MKALVTCFFVLTSAGFIGCESLNPNDLEGTWIGNSVTLKGPCEDSLGVLDLMMGRYMTAAYYEFRGDQYQVAHNGDTISGRFEILEDTIRLYNSEGGDIQTFGYERLGLYQVELTNPKPFGGYFGDCELVEGIEKKNWVNSN